MMEWLYSGPLAVVRRRRTPDGVIRYARRGKPQPQGVLAVGA